MDGGECSMDAGLMHGGVVLDNIHCAREEGD